MPHTESLLVRLAKEYTCYQFVSGTRYQWSAIHQTITYDTSSPINESFLLHELAHAILNHSNYSIDIKLLRQEGAAWYYAQTMLAPRYSLVIKGDTIDDCLESYREWIHKRSTCPVCSQAGLQVKSKIYTCMNCTYSWKVNDARQCQLRRLKLQDQSQIE